MIFNRPQLKRSLDIRIETAVCVSLLEVPEDGSGGNKSHEAGRVPSHVDDGLGLYGAANRRLKVRVAGCRQRVHAGQVIGRRGPHTVRLTLPAGPACRVDGEGQCFNLN